MWTHLRVAPPVHRVPRDQTGTRALASLLDAAAASGDISAKDLLYAVANLCPMTSSTTRSPYPRGLVRESRRLIDPVGAVQYSPHEDSIRSKAVGLAPRHHK